MYEQSSTQRDVSRCTDHELIVKLRQLVAADRALSVELLMHMGEMDARGSYREQAYASMFDYSVRALRMSEAEAYLRIYAARLGRQFPLILELLASGALHLTAIKLLGPYLTPDNHVQLLERARGKSKREVQQLMAEIAPEPDVPNQLRKLPQRGAQTSEAMAGVASSVQPDHADSPTPRTCRTAAAASSSPESSSRESSSPETAAPESATPESAAPESAAPESAAPESAAPECAALDGTRASHADAVSLRIAADHPKSTFALQSPRSRASCAPLSPGRYKLQLSVEQGLHDKLEQLQHLLRHRLPDGNLATIVELAVDLLLDKTLKQRFGHGAAAKKSPRARSAPSDDKRSDQAAALSQAERWVEKPLSPPQAQRPCAGARELTGEDHPQPSDRAPLAPEPQQHVNPLRAADTRVDPLRAADTRVDPLRAADTRVDPLRAADTRVDLLRAPDTRVDPLRAADTRVDLLRAPDTRVDPLRAADTRVDPLRAADAEVERVGAPPAPRAREPRSMSRYVPRSVLREVYARDGGQCTFVSADGRRCAARDWLEVHHHGTPYARGGAATADNLRLACRAHNAMYAERDFGRSYMLRKVQQVRAERASAAYPQANARPLQQLPFPDGAS